MSDWWKRIRSWFGVKDAEAERRAAITDTLFSSEEAGLADILTPSASPKTPLEEAFAEHYVQSLPDGKQVDRLLASKKGTRELLAGLENREKRVKLIVGLGNPGAKYVGTRHNIGYDVLAELGKRYGVGRPKSKFQGEILEGTIAGEKVILLSPVTYMNLSGQSVRPCMDFYKVQPADILIICDDISLPVAKIRVRSKGSSGGQKGLKDIIRVLGSENVARLRVGIGDKPPGWDLADYVLSKFNKDETELIHEAVRMAADAVELWVRDGIDRCMTRYNGDC